MVRVAQQTQKHTSCLASMRARIIACFSVSVLGGMRGALACLGASGPAPPARSSCCWGWRRALGRERVSRGVATATGSPLYVDCCRICWCTTLRCTSSLSEPLVLTRAMPAHAASATHASATAQTCHHSPSRQSVSLATQLDSRQRAAGSCDRRLYPQQQLARYVPSLNLPSSFLDL